MPKARRSPRSQLRNLAWLVLGLLPVLGAPAHAQTVLIQDVTVVRPASGAAIPHQDVLIRRGVIASLGPTTRTKPAPRTDVISGRGRYLIPGLWDAHVHLENAGKDSLAVLLALGITSVRDMGGNPATLAAWKLAVEAGRLAGPHIHYCGPMLEEPKGSAGPNHWPIAGPAEARAAVDSLRASGAECIKIRSAADLPTYLALGEAARKAGLPLVGHPLFAVDPVAAAAAGQQTYEHMFYPYPFATLDEVRRRNIIETFLKSHVRLTPTLVAWMPSTVTPNDQKARWAALTPDGASERHITPGLKFNWQIDVAQMFERGSPGWKKAIGQAAADLAEMHKAGVPILAGTDLGAPFVYPQTALYEELEYLVSMVGLTPAEALAAATTNPAALFDHGQRTGGLAVGYAADLVLLDADPLADIRNVRSVNTVFLAGKAYGPRLRRQLMERARADIRSLFP